ncbi:MAG: corrinoid protein [Candidatus Odinarchaeota archaeon]
MSLSKLVEEGEVYAIEDAVKEALKKTEPIEITEELITGLKLAGDRFKNGEYFVVDMMQAAETFKEGMKIIKPKLGDKKKEYKGKFVIGTVEGDIHDIGKNLVITMFEGAGFEVIDLGVDVSKEKFVDSVKNDKPDIIGLSALLTTTMLEMEGVIKALKANKLRDKIKIMIGGAPVSERFAQSIGADSFAPNATEAVDIALKLLGI